MRAVIGLAALLSCACSSLEGGAAASWGEAHALDEMMVDFLDRHDVPGAALAVSEDGAVVYSRGFGLIERGHRERVSATSLFRIASISKPITAVCVLQLVERGELSLEANPFELIGFGEALGGAGCDERLQQVTVRQLLSHRGGWDRGVSYDPMFQTLRIKRELGLSTTPSARDIIRFMLSEPLDFDPGEGYAYSNFGYCVLGRVIEAVTGQPYEEAVRERVLAPLGIKGMRIGRSLPEDRALDEVAYHDQKGR